MSEKRSLESETRWRDAEIERVVDGGRDRYSDGRTDR